MFKSSRESRKVKAEAAYLVTGDEHRVVDHGAVPQEGGMAQGVRPVGTEGPKAGGVAGGHGQTPTPGQGRERRVRGRERRKRAVSAVQLPAACLHPATALAPWTVPPAHRQGPWEPTSRI